MFGVDSGFTPPATADGDGNPLLAGLAHVPMALQDVPDPGFLLPDWVVTKPRLTGICGSDSKQVFMDWGERRSPDNPMKAFFSLPQVLGHEVVADVVALGPEAEGLEVGDRVVLNPWLSCGPRGVTPVCPACEVGDFSLCWTRSTRPIAPGIHIGTVERRQRRLRRADARARLACCSRCPTTSPTSSRCSPTRSRCRCTRSRGTRRRPAARCMVYGAGALGTCATAILRALYPDVEVLRRRALRGAGRDGAQARRDGDRRTRPREQVIEEAAPRGRAACSQRATACRWRSPAASTSCTTRSASRRRSRSALRVLKARGTLVKAGVHGPTGWEDTPLYFKEISMVGSNAFGFEEVDGVRKHGIEHYLDLVARRPGRPHRHAHPHLPARRLARRVHDPRRRRTTPARSRSRSTSDEHDRQLHD